jgi:hypothetical protein
MKRIAIFITLYMLLTFNGFSKSIEWSITPAYDELKPYTEEAFLCCKGNKWGLVSTGNKILLPIKYDYITTMADGYAVAGMRVGSQERIDIIINSRFETQKVSGTYYLIDNYYTYFSEGKLPITDKSGKQGFMNTSGREVIKCQFDNVHPFAEGYASVFNQPNAFYISEDYDRNPAQSTLPVEFNNGEITFASTFYKGFAVVAYKKKAVIIDKRGRKVQNHKGKINDFCYSKLDHTMKEWKVPSKVVEYSPTVVNTINRYAENGLYGYSLLNGTVVVYPSFSSATSVYSNGYAIVTLNNKVGVIHFTDDSVTSFLARSNESSALSGALRATNKGVVEKCDYVFSLPAHQQISDYRIYLNKGKGSLEEVNPQSTSDPWKIKFSPEPPDASSKNITIAAEIRYQGVTVHKYKQDFNLERKASLPTHGTTLQISGPAAKSERANDKDEIVIQAVISNPTGKSITTNATLSVPSKKKTTTQTITIPSGGTRSITLTLTKVIKTETVSTKLSLSTGESSSKQITLKPY